MNTRLDLRRMASEIEMIAKLFLRCQSWLSDYLYKPQNNLDNPQKLGDILKQLTTEFTSLTLCLYSSKKPDVIVTKFNVCENLLKKIGDILCPAIGAFIDNADSSSDEFIAASYGIISEIQKARNEYKDENNYTAFKKKGEIFVTKYVALSEEVYSHAERYYAERNTEIPSELVKPNFASITENAAMYAEKYSQAIKIKSSELCMNRIAIEFVMFAQIILACPKLIESFNHYETLNTTLKNELYELCIAVLTEKHAQVIQVSFNHYIHTMRSLQYGLIKALEFTTQHIKDIISVFMNSMLIIIS